jgi:hypothetical protein
LSVFFDPNAVSKSPEWREIGQLARDALRAFGWPLDEPPRRDNEFVPG